MASKFKIFLINPRLQPAYKTIYLTLTYYITDNNLSTLTVTTYLPRLSMLLHQKCLFSSFRRYFYIYSILGIFHRQIFDILIDIANKVENKIFFFKKNLTIKMQFYFRELRYLSAGNLEASI